ncbi:MAG TPA: hypothetical protein VIK22_04550 [Candidatus Anoxymicrobiaceae bacterium]
MTAQWPGGGARETYIRFLELELGIMKNAAERIVDAALLQEFNALLQESFPRTKRYLESKLGTDVTDGLTEEIRAIAWAEARSVPEEDGKAKVAGEWTEAQIGEDMNECFRIARERASR